MRNSINKIALTLLLTMNASVFATETKQEDSEPTILDLFINLQACTPFPECFYDPTTTDNDPRAPQGDDSKSESKQKTSQSNKYYLNNPRANGKSN